MGKKGKKEDNIFQILDHLNIVKERLYSDIKSVMAH